MGQYFLGVDVGSTNTRALIADEAGRALGFGASGPGNHEVVGYAGLEQALQAAAGGALAAAGLEKDRLSGAGFGVSGFDWPSELAPTLEAIASLGLKAPVEAANDAILGLLAGSAEGWGLALVSGTGCNCRGWDRERRREGRVTGDGLRMGEAAGASDLVARAVQAVAWEWTRRGPPTALTAAFLAYCGVPRLEDLLEGLVTGQVRLEAGAAPLVFQVAEAGDPVAVELVRWAGQELGELARAVIRQLGFEAMSFDVVLSGSMFAGGPLLLEPLQASIHALAPGARLSRLKAQPVCGAVLLGMEAAGLRGTPQVRRAFEKLQSP